MFLCGCDTLYDVREGVADDGNRFDFGGGLGEVSFSHIASPTTEQKNWGVEMDGRAVRIRTIVVYASRRALSRFFRPDICIRVE